MFMLSTKLFRSTTKLRQTVRTYIFNVQDEKDFEKRILKGDKPVLVDFYANWCGPCKIIGPRLEKLVSETTDAINLAKVDVDKLGDLAEKYDVTSLPTVIAFLKGKEVAKFIGVKEEDFLDSFIKKITDGPL